MKIPDGQVLIFHDNHGQEVDVEVKELVLCKNCKHRPIKTDDEGMEYEFPDEKCPCQCEDYWYSWMPKDDWFCAEGEREEE